MKTFKDIIAESDHEEVLDKVVKIHFESTFKERDPEEETKCHDAYRWVLQKLLSYGEWTWFRSKYGLFFKKTQQLLGDDEETLSVCLLDKTKDDSDRDKSNASIHFMPWRVTVNLEVTTDDSVHQAIAAGEISIDDMVAEYLYEITFDGFEETGYFKMRDELKQRIAEIDSGEVELIPFEDVKEQMKTWIEEIPSGSIADDDILNDCETD
jgi:hypothetical protein